MSTTTPTAAYTRAEARVNATPELDAYRDIILSDDWTEGDHLDWVATASVAEIVSWAAGIAVAISDAADDCE